MTRQTLRDFLASAGRPASTSISISSDPASAAPAPPDPSALAEGDDLGVDPNTGLPLLSTAGPSLTGDYAAYITARNNYPLRQGNKLAPSPTRGQDLEDPTIQGSESVFAPPASARQLSNYSNSGYFETGTRKLSDLISKTGGTGPRGDELLKTISSVDGRESSAQIYAEDAYDSENTYNPDQAFSRRTRSADVDPGTNIRVQRKIGDWKKIDGQDARTSTLETLKSVGLSLLLKAAHRDASDSPAGSIDPASPAASDAQADKYASVNFDTQISEQILRALNAFGAPTFDDGSAFLGGRGDFVPEDPDARYSKSYGVSYTPTTPSDQTASTERESPEVAGQNLESSVRLAAASVLILSKLLRQIYSESIDTLEFNPRKSLGLGPYKLGYSVGEDYKSLELAHFRSIFPNTAPYTFEECLKASFKSVFGLEMPSRAVDILAASPAQTFSTGELSSLVSNRILRESPSYWISIAKSAIYAYTATKKSMTPTQGASQGRNFAKTVQEISNLRATRFVSGMITMGYISLISTYGSNRAPILGNAEETPLNRVSRSRDTKGNSPNAGAWRGNALPSVFLLPGSSVLAGPKLGNTIFRANPARAMLASTLADKTVVDPNIGGEGSNRLPQELVHLIENKLEAEYVPFYFQDLRTNEVIAFHAFIESVTDGFSASYNTTKSYGRADPVYNYSSTTRSIAITFSIVATNREDYDEMWFKINKLTTLMYPQYTRGQKISGRNGLLDYEFEAPFSQVPGATPVIRLRLGDLIKSNYSKLAAARLFGLGSKKNFKTTIAPGAGALRTLGSALSSDKLESLTYFVFLIATASPAVVISERAAMTRGLTGPGSSTAVAAAAIGEIAAYEALAATDPVDGRGYINPFILNTVRNNLLDPQTYKEGTQSETQSALGGLNSFNTGESGSDAAGRANLGDLIGSIVTVFPITSGWNNRSDGRGLNLVFNQPVKGVLTNKVSQSGTSLSTSNSNTLRSGKDMYEIQIVEGDQQGQKIWVPRGGFAFDSQGLIQTLFAISNPVSAVADGLTSLLFNSVPIGSDFPNTEGAVRQIVEILTNPDAAFFSSFDNPYFDKNEVISGYENTMGRGLAGVIENMSFGWDFAWETDFGSRAPMGCKVTLKFSPIHDVPPGLDADGFNRAPIYNAGRIMNDFSGDPIDRELGARASFSNANKTVTDDRSVDLDAAQRFAEILGRDS